MYSPRASFTPASSSANAISSRHGARVAATKLRIGQWQSRSIAAPSAPRTTSAMNPDSERIRAAAASRASPASPRTRASAASRSAATRSRRKSSTSEPEDHLGPAATTAPPRAAPLHQAAPGERLQMLAHRGGRHPNAARQLGKRRHPPALERDQQPALGVAQPGAEQERCLSRSHEQNLSRINRLVNMNILLRKNP